MSGHLADNEPAEQGHDAPVGSPVATDGDPRKLLVSFRNRAMCTVVDLFVVIFIIAQSGDALRNAGWAIADSWAGSRAAVAGIVVLYFALAWASPLGATPVQFLWGIRVVDYDGKSLRPWRALLRSVLVVVLTAGMLAVLQIMREPYMAIVGVCAIGLLFAAAVTPHRQAAHDLLLRSLVVYRRALKQPEFACLLHCTGDRNTPEPRSIVRLRFADLLLDIVTLAIPLALLAVAVQMHHNKNMNARVNYAIRETREVKLAVRQFHLEHGKFPADALELGVAQRTGYPDGGYYELQVNGTLRIRFTVKPELKNGSLLLTPSVNSDKFVWRCSVEGTFDVDYLPSSCRH
ncbi:MAG: putative RDD family membrane protein YckC [Gammaproteobacteria bacterium]|jgi:uncharacterized RDD family membrane protein YckC